MRFGFSLFRRMSEGIFCVVVMELGVYILRFIRSVRVSGRLPPFYYKWEDVGV